MKVFDPDPDAVPRARLAPPQRPAPLRRRQIAAGLSVLVHLVAIALFLFALPSPPVDLSADPSIEVVYEDATSAAPSTSPVTNTDRPAAEQAPARPAPPETVPPAPMPVPVKPPAPDAQPAPPPPEVTPPTAAPTPPEPTPPEPMQPDTTPPAPEPATPSVPVVRLEAPPTSEPAPAVPEFRSPAPPPPLSSRPPPPPRVAQRPRIAPGFSPPIDLSYGPAPTAPMSRPLAGPGSRAIDLALGAPKPGPNRQEAFYDARAKKIGADWANGLSAWWLAHRYYPRQAAENGDDGTVKVELTVNRSGKVESVNVMSRSGSPFLDMAALSVWRGAQLAPFPAENTKERETMEITINYLLIR